MAKHIELGLILEGEDAKQLWEDRKHPTGRYILTIFLRCCEH